MPLKQGGTGTRSDEDMQPEALPERYESGNLNMAGIAGLEAGVSHVAGEGPGAAQQRIRSLIEPLLKALGSMRGVKVYGPPANAARAGVVSFNLEGYDPQELAALLDAQWSIQTRAGIHCAPRMHAALGTLPRGTLRLSPGHFTTEAEIDAVLAALGEITAT